MQKKRISHIVWAVNIRTDLGYKKSQQSKVCIPGLDREACKLCDILLERDAHAYLATGELTELVPMLFFDNVAYWSLNWQLRPAGRFGWFSRWAWQQQEWADAIDAALANLDRRQSQQNGE